MEFDLVIPEHGYWILSFYDDGKDEFDSSGLAITFTPPIVPQEEETPMK